MSIYATAHIHDDTVIEQHEAIGERGYVRILPNFTAPAAAHIHADAAGFRRLAAACLNLADDLDSAEETV